MYFLPSNSSPIFTSQIEDLSQQAHKAAAEKFKVPVTSSPLAPPVPPSLTIKEESEEEEEEVRSQLYSTVSVLTLCKIFYCAVNFIL